MTTKQIKLTAKINSSTSFQFIAGTWIKQLKNAKSASFTFENIPHYGGRVSNSWKHGDVLAFDKNLDLGIPGYHVERWLKTLDKSSLVSALITASGILLQSTDKNLKCKIEILLKPSAGGTVHIVEFG